MGQGHADRGGAYLAAGIPFFVYGRAGFSRIRVSGVIRVLGGGELEGTDRDFADMLYRQNGVLGTIRLAEEGDRCVIRDSIWENWHGVIMKVDRSRRRCCVEFEFDHTKRTVWVGYDMVKTDRLMETENITGASGP